MNKNFLSQNLSVGGQKITGPLQGIETIGDLINKILPFILGLAGIILLFVLILAGYDLIMSQGNAEKIKNAQAKITTGLIGLFLLIFSYLIVSLIAKIFGLGGGLF